MYRHEAPGQLKIENFELPFGGKLSKENRWVKLSELIPWEEFESGYAEQFSKGMGAPAKSFRMALGALIIKEKLGLSDEETVEQLRENPYLQYFVGLSSYQEEAPFEASMLVHFRKRLGMDYVNRVNERVISSSVLSEPVAESSEPVAEGQETVVKSQESDSSKSSGDKPPGPPPPSPPNQGKLLLDASCTPADIHYPTDLSLLNEAREQTEWLIDRLYVLVKENLAKKPRTYRQKARKQYLSFAKQRRLTAKQRRKAIRQQLGCVRRNLGHIDQLIEQGADLSKLSRYRYKMLLVVHELYRQQQWMFDEGVKRIDDRIVSLSQPHVRPIVRGKAGCPVEFGAKIAISCVEGFVHLERLSWDNFNESVDLPEQVEHFKTQFGVYPESVHVDQIYRTRSNRDWCKARGIRMSGPPLGRRAVALEEALKQQTREDQSVRVEVEGKFGQGKRRFGWELIKAKLAQTSETAIAITCLVMNLERRLMPSFCALLRRLDWFLSILMRVRTGFEGRTYNLFA